MATKWEAIKQELTADPIGVGYASMTDQQAADALSARNRVRKRPLPTHEIKKYMVLNDLWLPIKQSTTAEAQIALDALATFEFFDVADAATGALVEAKLTSILDGLIAKGLITATHKTDILAMANEPISRAEDLGFSPVTPVDVAKARRLP